MAVTEITNENFKSFVLDSNKPVLIDFGRPGAAPRRMVSPLSTNLRRNWMAKPVSGKSMDEQPELAAQFGIMSIPTLPCFQRRESSLKKENRSADKAGINGNARCNRTPSPMR